MNARNGVRGLVGLSLALVLFLIGGHLVARGEAVARGKSPAERVVVRSTAWYVSADGQWLNIVGEVENVSNGPVGPIWVRATYRDAAGRRVGQDMGYVLVSPLFPGERAPFHLLDRPVPAAVTYTLSVLAFPRVADPMPSLEITAVSTYTLPDGAWVLVGEVRNPTDVPVSRVRLPVTLYGADGRVRNVAQAQVLREVLPPGEASPFVVRVNEGPREVASWAFIARYRKAAAARVPAGVVAHGLRAYLNTAGHPVVSGAVSNYGSRRVTFVRVVAALYDADGRLLDASFSYPLTYHLDPGETDIFAVRFARPISSWASYRVWIGASLP